MEPCPDDGACVALSVDAPELGAVALDQLEVVVRTAAGSRTHTIVDQPLRLPLTVPVLLPELDETPGQEVNLYLRATWDGGALHRLALAASLRLDGEPRARGAVSLFRPCLSEGCPSPGGRQDAAMVYDLRSRRVILFGGSRGDTVLDDTWEWDGARWYEVVAAQRPPARAGHAMAYDPQRGRPVLFGGLAVAMSALPGGVQLPLGDTWEYLGAPAGWHRIASEGPVPGARSLPAMSTSPLSQRYPGTGEPALGVLLFGGLASDGQPLGDTWLWDGARGRWQERPELAVPCGAYAPVIDRAPRCRAGAAMAMVRDPSRDQGVVVMLGGVTGRSSIGTATFDELVWRWDGGAWTRMAVDLSPHVLRRWRHRLAATVPATGGGTQLLLAGGELDGTVLGDAFLMDLTQGLFVPQIGPAPQGRAGAALALDEERGEVVLAGGRGEGGELADTWTFQRPSGWVVRR